jgi:hypothetical protein
MIREIAPGRGACLASDRITVGGERVGFMCREAPRDEVDSGWCFLSGTESQEYLDDPRHLAVYDVNTIVNYDKDVVPLLDAPVGSAFERSGARGFRPVAPPPAE